MEGCGTTMTKRGARRDGAALHEGEETWLKKNREVVRIRILCWDDPAPEEPPAEG